MKLNEIRPIVVGGLVVEVNTPTQDLINCGLLGHYLPSQLEIGVRGDLPEQLQGNVLTHEMVHAIANVYCEGLGLNEAQVAGIAQGLYQVLGDNEDVVAFITQTTVCDCDSEEHTRDVETIMNGHVRSPVPTALGHEYEFDDH